MAGADALQQVVELGSVVEVAEVAEFVEDDVVPQMCGDQVETDVEVDIPLGGAGAPIALVVLQGNPSD